MDIKQILAECSKNHDSVAGYHATIGDHTYGFRGPMGEYADKDQDPSEEILFRYPKGHFLDPSACPEHYDFERGKWLKDE